MSETRMQQRRATANDWTMSNPVLREGEFGVELDTFRVKVGDSQTPWIDLPYIVGESTVPTITNNLQSSLSIGERVNFNLALSKTFLISAVDVSHSGLRLRLYPSAGLRSVDASRPIGVDPTGSHGLLLEFVSTPTLKSMWLSPAVVGYRIDANVAASLDSTEGSDGNSVNVQLTWVRI